MNPAPAAPDLRAPDLRTPDLRTPDLRVLAVAFAGRFALIAAALVALIARAFLHQPGLAPLIIPLHRRLSRAVRGIATLMARLGAGKPAARRRGEDRDREGRSRPPNPHRIPTTEAWLVRTLRHEAAGYASQLSHLLAEPGMSELLAAAPTAQRLLRPLCRMLGIPPAALCAVGRDRCAPSRTPDTAPSAVAPPAAGARLRPENAAAPARTESAAASPPPPCPHVGWPWFPRPAAKST